VRVPGTVTGSFEGRLGELGVVGSVQAEGRKLTAELKLPSAEAEAVRALWPAWPLRLPLSARLEARGTLPILQTRTELEVGPTRVGVRGPVRLAGDVGAHLELEAEHLDLNSLFAGVPTTNLDSKGSIIFLVRQGKTIATFTASTEPTVLAGQKVPALTLQGQLAGQSLGTTLDVREPGMPIKLELTLEPNGSLGLMAKSGRFRLERATRIAELTPAQGDAEFELQARLANAQVEANLQARVRDLTSGELHVGDARLEGRLKAPVAELDRAEIDLRLEASRAKAGLFSLTRVTAQARGPISRPEIELDAVDATGLALNLSGRYDPRQNRADRLAVVVSRPPSRLEGRAEALELGREGLAVKNLELHGAGGKLQGSLRLQPELLEVVAEGTDLDFDVWSHTLGLPAGLVGGRVRLQADVAVGSEISRGRVRLAVVDGSFMHHKGIDWELSADLAKHHLEGNTALRVNGLGELEARFATELGGPALTRAAWQRVTGQLALDIAQVDLQAVSKLLGLKPPIPKLSGSMSGWVNLDRPEPLDWPNLVARFATRGLRWQYGEEGAGSGGASLEGIEFALGASLVGASGQFQGTLQATDLEGTLCAATVQTSIDLHQLRQDPARMAKQLAETPFRAVVDVPERPLVRFPPLLRADGVSGRASLRLILDGQPANPLASIELRAKDLQWTNGRFELPLDVDGSAQYQSSTGRLTGSALVRWQARQVALLAWQAEAPWQAVLLGGNPEQPSWRGEALLRLSSFPMAALPPLAEARVEGAVSGEVHIERQNQVPTALAELTFADATVERISLGTGQLTLKTTADLAVAELGLKAGQGSVAALVRAGLNWGGDFVELDRKRPIQATVRAQRFEAAALAPLVRDVLTNLSGSVDLDASGEIGFEPDSKNPQKLNTTSRFSGRGSLKGGVLELAGLGLELRNVECQVAAYDQGESTKIELRKLRGSARSTQQNVEAWADLYLRGPRVERGQGALWADRVPLPIEGVNVANARGRAELELERKSDKMQVRVKVTELLAELPRSSTRSVIPLTDNPRIRVAQPLGEPQEPPSSAALPWLIEFELGNRVRIERGDIYLPVTGKPRLWLGERTEVDGYVDLEPGGRLTALGKVFQVDSGRVWFDSEEPTNPRINITARWRGPEATIFIDVRGRWKNAQLDLRSDPPRPQPELLMILLQGSANEDPGSPGRGQALIGAQTAASVLGLADVFAGTPLGNVELRADSSEGNEAYAATVRVSDRVWVEGIYRRQTALGSVGNGANPSEPGRENAFAGAVDLRLGRDWTLRTEGGNASAAVDLLWQYRY
jgi:translocation and assembly module TamB